MSVRGDQFVVATKQLDDNDRVLYAEVSIYVSAPDGYSIDEDRLREELEAAATLVFEGAVSAPAAPEVAPEVTNEAVVPEEPINPEE